MRMICTVNPDLPPRTDRKEMVVREMSAIGQFSISPGRVLRSIKSIAVTPCAAFEHALNENEI